ncbi:MAG TPA: TIGR02217 family protein [Hellea balneolensis]|uniref:TIGR02217 family protein n=1 Tax=Hellea balneolensis TaxID=287478 RepID=A0A7C5LS27_9PROT|nr:TIGR02217 family protein [Hellea balneolensis]
MTGFHDVRFPLPLAFGASGGPVRTTQISTLANGFEQRNTAQAHSRRQYDAGVGVKHLDDFHTLIAFFEARRGELYGFRFRDPLDHKSCPPSQSVSADDQKIGVGDGVETEFYLQKTYADLAGSWVRPITKPVAGTVVLSLDGNPTNTFNIDPLSGQISFSTPPGAGVIIRAGFEFDVPVRFATHQLTTALEAFGTGENVHIPLIEILDHA